MSVDIRRYTQHLHQLVATPSVSCAIPRWDMSNKQVLDLLANWLDDLGFNTEILPVPEQPGKYNLLAVLGQGDGGLVLAGHSDTVPYDEHSWHNDPLQLTERDGKFYGLGATDMKGFFPAVLEAVRSINPAQLIQPIIVLATADEESSMSGARALAASGALKARYALVGEPTGLKPIYMHKGILMEAVRVRGKSGHSSNPALGNNALEAMHEVMAELLQYRQDLQDCYHNPGFAVALPTLNLGCLHGGDGANRICGECELHFDLRSLPGMHSAELRHNIKTRLTPVAERRGVDIVFSTLFEGVEPFYQDPLSDLIVAAQRLSGHPAEAVNFATEAPFYTAMGLQTVVLGPGSIDQAHQSNEFIDPAQIDPFVTILRGLIQQFCLSPATEASA